ncbi:MAG: potassium/proton antiporter, partial [Chloroflexales bacterium]|nr:potassium/proton antiporter [Chloroflexales bacterium]
FAHQLLGFSWLEGLLLGAIISSTDAAAVFSVMRTSSVKLRGTLEPLIELESGSNDPIAVFLTLGLISLLVDPSASVLALVPRFFWQMALGAALGYALGRATAYLINRIRLNTEGLYPVLTVSTVLLAYGATALLGGNGFLAVYVAGVALGNQNFVHKRSLARFHDALAWLMQIALFLTLGLLVFPSQLVPVAGGGLLTALFLILVARPLSVFAALLLSGYGWREKLLIAWSGLRGAVPIVLATFPLLGGVGSAQTLFNLVFFIVLASVLLQGTTIPLLARLLGLNDPRQPDYHYPQEFVPSVDATSQVAEITVRSGAQAVGLSIMELGLPAGALVILVRRGDDKLVPSGATVLEAGDQLLVLAGVDALPTVRARLGD